MSKAKLHVIEDLFSSETMDVDQLIFGLESVLGALGIENLVRYRVGNTVLGTTTAAVYQGAAYLWKGVFPKVIAFETPDVEPEWVKVDQIIDNTSTMRMAVARLAAEAGFNLVNGSFEEGGSLVNPEDVLWYRGDGKYYSWFNKTAKTVAVGSTPQTTGGISGTAWVDRTQDTIRSELSGAEAPMIAPTLSATYLASWLDTTGATDHTSDIAELFTKYNCVKLPDTGSGFIRADITVPAGCTLLASGQKTRNRTSSAWEGRGTLIKGTLNQTGIVGFVIGNLTIDNYDSGGNAVQGLSAGTGFGYLKNVTTRANNHNHLWEANDDNPSNTNAIGDIVCEDCIAHGGPNGFVSKHKNVSFIRCIAYDNIVQSHVAVSDNINGPTIYSRAYGTKFIDCSAICAGTVSTEGVRVYSRDYNDPVGANRALTVLSAFDTYVERYSTEGVLARKLRIGDFSSTATTGNFTRVTSVVNRIRNNPYSTTQFSCHHVEYADRTDFIGCHWGYQQNVSVGDNYNQLDCDPKLNHIRAGSSLTGATALGVESGRLIISDNSATLVPTAKQTYFILQNTITTTVTGISYANIGYEVTILIDDDFSIVNVGGVSHKGKGTVVRYRYNGSNWSDLGELRQRGIAEFTAGSASGTVVFNLSSGQLNQLWNTNGTSITSITLSNTLSISAGEKVTIRVTNPTGSSVSISGWDSNIKWPDTTSPVSSIAGFRKLILELTCIGNGVFVVTGQTVYV